MYDTSGGTYNGSQYDTLARLEVRYQYDNKTAPYTAAENFASIMMGLNNASGISAPEPDKASYRTAILNRM